jgi:hypothetical protein
MNNDWDNNRAYVCDMAQGLPIKDQFICLSAIGYSLANQEPVMLKHTWDVAQGLLMMEQFTCLFARNWTLLWPMSNDSNVKAYLTNDLQYRSAKWKHSLYSYPHATNVCPMRTHQYAYLGPSSEPMRKEFTRFHKWLQLNQYGDSNTWYLAQGLGQWGNSLHAFTNDCSLTNKGTVIPDTWPKVWANEETVYMLLTNDCSLTNKGTVIPDTWPLGMGQWGNSLHVFKNDCSLTNKGTVIPETWPKVWANEEAVYMLSQMTAV